MAKKDWMIACLDEIVEAGERVREALADVDALLAVATRERRAGGTPVEVTEGLIDRGSRRVRSTAAASFDDFEHAVMTFRQVAVRTLIEKHGWTVSQVARRTGVSRQRTSALYQAAKRI